MANIRLKDPKKLIAAAEGASVPSGKVEITSTAEVDVAGKATAQVVDANLIAGNIKKGVTILGVEGTYEATQIQQ